MDRNVPDYSRFPVRAWSVGVAFGVVFVGRFDEILQIHLGNSCGVQVELEYEHT